MPTIQIDALDTLFFRDSKTFTKGEDTWADTMFPPYPSVIYGALRSAYFAENTSKLKDANIEGKDDSLKLVIKNICLKLDDLYFPLPLDCVQEKGWSNNPEKKEKVFVISPNALNEKTLSSCPVNNIIQSNDDKQIENVSDGILKESILENYLKGNTNAVFSIKKRSEYLSLEPKIGIARSKNTHTSEDGQLYRVGMNRLESKLKENKTNKLSIIVDFEGLELSNKDGIMKMGGEGKAVRYETINDSIKVELSQITNGKFKLYLSTPVIFANGWLPGSFDKDSLVGTINGVKVKLITAAIGKSISIGGWDIKRGCPKTMRKAVPAGSVYYFELLEGNVEDLIKINGNSISDYNAKQGFGIAYVGTVANA